MNKLKSTNVEDTRRIEEQVQEIDRLYRRLRLMGFNIGHDREMKADLLSVEDDGDEFLEEPQQQKQTHSRKPQKSFHMDNMPMDDDYDDE